MQQGGLWWLRMLTQAQIQTVIDEAKCCLATRQGAYVDTVHQGNASDCKLKENILLTAYLDTLSRFTTEGTVIEEAQIATATFDLTSISLPATITAEITVGVTVLGSVSGAYSALSVLLNDMAASINLNSGVTGYTATYTTTTLTIHAPAGSGSSLNGTLITITIENFFYRSDSFSLNVYQPDTLRGAATVNNASSPFMYGMTFISGYDDDVVYVITNDGQVPSFIASIPLSASGNPNFCLYSPTTERIYVGLQGLPFSYDVIACTAPMPTPSFTVTTNSIGVFPNTFTDGIYNPIDTFVYTVSSGSGRVYKLSNTAPFGISTTLNPALIPAGIAVNTKNTGAGSGDIWVLASNGDATIFNTAGAVASTLVEPDNSELIIYCADIHLMLIFNSTTTNIDGWNPDTYTKTDPDYITLGNTPTRMFYSDIFNKFFIEVQILGVTHIYVFNQDGTEFQAGTPLNEVQGTLSNSVSWFSDDNNSGEVVRVRASVSALQSDASNVDFINLNSDQDEFINPLLDGTPEALSTEEDNCITQAQTETIVSHIKKLCKGICGCTDSESSSSSNNTTGYMIYYGRDADTTVSAVEILAFSSVSQGNFAGDYSFIATPATYTYICYPSLLGSPSSIIDVNTLLPVAVLTPYATVSVLGENYTVIRSFNHLGGAITIRLTQ